MQPSLSATQQSFPVPCSSEITVTLRHLAGIEKAIILQEHASNFQIDFVLLKKQSKILLLLSQDAAKPNSNPKPQLL